MSDCAYVSVKLMSAVWALELPSSEKFVLLALADNANDQGYCWPSVATICAKTSLASRTVQGIFNRLRSSGLISILERWGQSHVFYLAAAGTAPSYADTPAESAPPQNLHPAESAPPPPQNLRVPPQSTAHTPAESAPRTIRNHQEPSVEKRKRAAVASRLPDDFGFTDERREYAKTRKLDPEATMEDFRDFWTQCNTPNAVKRDWDAAWRMWCRRQVTFKAKDNGQRAPKKTRFAELTEGLEASINGNG